MGRINDFELLLIRHGDAEGWAEGGDAARALTDRGRARLLETVDAYVRAEWFWTKAWSSPYLRARQTAGLLHEALLPRFSNIYGDELCAPELSELLTPMSDPETAARFLVQQGGRIAGPRPRVAVFAHNPLLQGLASVLLTGKDTTAHINIGRGDVVHMFVPAPSPFDLILDPVNEEPLPRAILLGMYPRKMLAGVTA